MPSLIKHHRWSFVVLLSMVLVAMLIVSGIVPAGEWFGGATLVPEARADAPTLLSAQLWTSCQGDCCPECLTHPDICGSADQCPNVTIQLRIAYSDTLEKAWVEAVLPEGTVGCPDSTYGLTIATMTSSSDGMVGEHHIVNYDRSFYMRTDGQGHPKSEIWVRAYPSNSPESEMKELYRDLQGPNPLVVVSYSAAFHGECGTCLYYIWPPPAEGEPQNTTERLLTWDNGFTAYKAD